MLRLCLYRGRKVLFLSININDSLTATAMIKFWKEWPAAWRGLFWAFTLMVGVVLCAFLYFYLGGNVVAMDWNVISKTVELPITLRQIELGLGHTSISVNYLLLNQYFEGSGIQYSLLGNITFWLLCLTGYSMLWAVVSGLPRRLYYIGATLLSACLWGFQLDVIIPFGRFDNLALLITLLLFMGVSYLIQVYRTQMAMLGRFATFLILTIGAIGMLHYAATESYPLERVMTFGVLPWVALAGLFIFLVSIDNFWLLFRLIGGRKAIGNNFGHFIAVSLVYLSLLGIGFWQQNSNADNQWLFYSPFILLLASSVVGLWAFQAKELAWGHWLPFRPLGALLYLALMLICWTTVLHYFIVGSDVMLEMLSKLIYLSHLCVSGMFFIYLFVNFSEVIRMGKDAASVVFRGNKMNLGTVYIFGLATMMTIMARDRFVQKNQLLSAYYNGIADLNYAHHESTEAEGYYNKGAQYGWKNHHSFYGLATLANEQGRLAKALMYYESANVKHPSPFAYVNISNIYLSQNQYFDAVFTLEEGLKLFPDNKQLKTNLALVYQKSNKQQAADFLAVLKNDADVGAINTVNWLAFKGPEGQLSAQELSGLKFANNTGVKANLLAISPMVANSNITAPKTNTVADLPTLAEVYNYSFYAMQHQDTAWAKSLATISTATANDNFQELLSYGKAIYHYEVGQVSQGVQEMKVLSDTYFFHRAFYEQMLSKWMVDLGEPQAAVPHVTKGLNLADSVATDLAFNVLLEAGRAKDAAEFAYREPQKQLLAKLEGPSAKGWSDDLLFLKMRFHQTQWEFEQQLKVVDQMKDQQYQVKALRWLWQVAMKFDQWQHVSPLIARLQSLGDDAVDLALSLAVYHHDVPKLQKALPHLQGDWKLLAAASIKAANKDTTAMSDYHQLLKRNPYFAPAATSATQYLADLPEKDDTYQLFLTYLNQNQYSVPLTKGYALQSVSVGLDDYGLSAIEDVMPYTSPEAFKQLESRFEQEVAEKEKTDEQW